MAAAGLMGCQEHEKWWAVLKLLKEHTNISVPWYMAAIAWFPEHSIPCKGAASGGPARWNW